MLLGDLLRELDERGVSLRFGSRDGRLEYSPPGSLPPDLRDELRRRKEEVVRVLREDDEFRRTGVIRVERQAFEVAREFFGNGGGRAT